jgi:7-cyano-7-deazaguanine synthase
MVKKDRKNTKAVVLLSGGMDSSTCLAMAKSEGFECHSIAFDYGQRHDIELKMAQRQAQAQGVKKHLVVSVDLRSIGGSALTDDLAVPKQQTMSGIPVTYVPARNTVFLSLALSWAEVIGAQHLFIGANQVDYSGYPDCRRAFLDSFERMANLATRMGTEGRTIQIHAPLLDLSKAEIIQKGLALGVNYQDTHTCYDPMGELSCGKCPSCRLRLLGFAAAGVKDPLTYQIP